MFENIVIDKNIHRIDFEIHNIDTSIVNGLRRILISDIPIVAFYDHHKNGTIEILENTGALNNDEISHRISMIPIHLRESELDDFQNGVSSFEILIEADKEQDITTDDIVVRMNDKNVRTLDYFPHNVITNAPELITRLRRNEKLKIKATGMKGTARIHTCFSIVSAPAYYFKENENSKKTGILEKQRDCDENIKMFHFELLNNNISHKYVFGKSIDVLISKIVDFSKEIEAHDSGIVSLEKYNENSYDFVIKDENDTLGNIIQSYIYDNYVIKKKERWSMECIYIGYACLHPINKVLNIRMTIKDNSNVKDFKNYMYNVCNEILETVLYPMKEEWNQKNND